MKSKTHANRGKALEQMVESTNEHYKSTGRALISKAPTDWVVIRRGKDIVSAFPKKKGMPDFIGISHGKSVCFDAKSTKERTRFPLSNIHEHQHDFLLHWYEQGGCGFYLIHFEKFEETYFVHVETMEEFMKIAREGGRKSIPYEVFVTTFDLVTAEKGVLLNYLKYV